MDGSVPNQSILLTLVTFLPLVGAVAIAVAPLRWARLLALGAALVTWVVSLVLAAGFNAQASAFQFVEAHTWINAFGIQYKLGVDGLSVALVPMYLIIGIWGGQNRIYATIKFVLYTLVGSLLMLVAILATAFTYQAAHGGAWTGAFDFVALRDYAGTTGFADGLQLLSFVAFFLAFAIKVPMFPFHTWLPDAHVEAPTAGSVILAGVLLKL